jgi:glutamate racemase
MLKIGIFDSGLGGLTVVKALQDVIKGAEFFYIADTKHAPYGEKTLEQILQYSLHITQHFIDKHQINALVIACNTATSAAIEILRENYPELIIIGTEPAIKPAIEQTKTGRVGVLATPATLSGDKYQSLVEKLSSTKKVTLIERACPGLVEHIENGTLRSKESLKKLETWLSPMREAEVDTIVLGCTHYPLASKVIKEVMQIEVVLLDSSKAIAQRLLSLLTKSGHKNEGELTLKCYATGSIDKVFVKKLVKSPISLIIL